MCPAFRWVGSGTGGTGGTGGSAAGTGGTGGTGAGGSGPVTIEIIGKRVDKEAAEFWVMDNDLVWLGLPNAGGNRTPFRVAIAGGNAARMSNLIVSPVASMVPDTNNPGVFFDGEANGFSGVGRFSFANGLGIAATAQDAVTLVASSSGHVCWVERSQNAGSRVVCRTRVSTDRVGNGEVWQNVGSLAATTKWVYFTQANTLMRWDRTSNAAVQVAPAVQRVKAIGDVVWAFGANGHVVRVADGGSTVDYGNVLETGQIIGISTGVTAPFLYVALSTVPRGSLPNRIVRVAEAEGAVSTVVENACATTISSVGANNKYVYFLCGDDNIYRQALP